MAALATPGTLVMCVAALCALSPACKKPAPRDQGPDLQVISEALRLRIGDPVPRSSPFFDGQTVKLVAARGEVLAFQVLNRASATTSLSLPSTSVRSFSIEPAIVKRPSTTGLFGRGHGAGAYPDILSADNAPSERVLFEVVSSSTGTHRGELVIDERKIPVELTIVDVQMPELTPRVWAYYDPRELVWAKLGTGTHDAPSDHERACIATFREYGVMLTPDLPITAWPARRDLLAGFPFVPVKLGKDPATAGDEVRAWIAATQGSGHVPFAIPIDEPRKPDARAKVKALSAAVRAAGAGPNQFLYAVTAEPHPELGDAIDLYMPLRAKLADKFPRWTYNGAPPRAGSLVLDGESPGPRTWGFIAHRYTIPIWYVWDALYWHDRHNRKGAPLPGRAFDYKVDATSFDDGEDHGNLDGVLALPGDDKTPCVPTLRLAAIRRGVQDRSLIELAHQCNAAETQRLVEQMVPRALGDAPDGSAPAWPRDDAVWEDARRKLLALASCAK